MALIKCPECGKEISDRAGTCPNCGYPIEETKKKEAADETAVKEEKETKQQKNKEQAEKELSQEQKEKGTPNSKKPFPKKAVIAIAVILVIVLAAGIGYYVMTQDSRNYKSAQQLFQDEKYEEALQKFTELGDYEDSKKMVEQCHYELSVDGQFMRGLSKGLMKRWDKNDEYIAQGLVSEDPDQYSEFCDVELNEIEEFYNKTFDDPGLKEEAKLYIDSLREAKEATKYYTVDYNRYATQWADVYEKRILLIKKFVEEYGLTVDKDYQGKLDDILVDAEAVKEQLDTKESIQKMTEGFKVNVAEDEWGIKKYTVNMKNTTDLTFDYIGMEISVLDKNGNIIGNGTVSQVTSWKPGQEATVDAYFDKDISLEDCTLEYALRYQSGSYIEY